MDLLRKKTVLLASTAALALGTFGATGIAQARHGADDPVTHDARDDHGGHHRAHAARHGADDAVAHHRHGRHHRERGDDRGGDR
jgi:hypothetical protein